MDSCCGGENEHGDHGRTKCGSSCKQGDLHQGIFPTDLLGVPLHQDNYVIMIEIEIDARP